METTVWMEMLTSIEQSLEQSLQQAVEPPATQSPRRDFGPVIAQMLERLGERFDGWTSRIERAEAESKAADAELAAEHAALSRWLATLATLRKG